MAQIPYRGNLAASTFPLISANFGRSVIIRGQDQNYVPPAASPQDPDKDVGIPQVYYCHNVVPTSEGFKSVGYIERTPAVGATEDNFISIEVIQLASLQRALLSLTSDGRRFIAKGPSYIWTEITGELPSEFAGRTLTTAFISGVTYIYVSNFGCYTYNEGTNTLDPVTLTGLIASEIIGIVAVGGYLVAYSLDAIAWSSTIDPTDFVPSLSTGAGGGIPEGLKGTIVFVAASTNGMFIFTTVNCIPALLSGNIRFPFNFREIVNTGGVFSKELIAYDSNSNNLWSYTTAGLQQVTVQQSQTVFPAVTDFVSGNLFEDFDENLDVFTYTKLTSPFKKKLAVVSDRYWILSYGVEELTHALYYDLVLRRWGKLKITHTDCFEWVVRPFTEVDSPKNSIGFLQKNGKVVTVDFDSDSANSQGVLVLGKFQVSRTRNVTLDEIELENASDSDRLEVKVVPSYDGKNPSQIISPYLAVDQGSYKKYTCRATGVNVSLVIKNSFNLVSFVLKLHVDGRR